MTGPEETAGSGGNTAFYRVLADHYDTLFPAAPETVDLLEQLARRSADEASTPRVLDVGCGSGGHLRGLLRRGLDGSGFDLSPEMIERAARLDPDHADRYYVADMQDTADAPGGPFHLVFSLGNTISHLSSLEEIGHWIRAVASVLTNGGRIALQFMDVSDLSVGETIDLPQLTSWYGNQTVALDRHYLRDSATTIRFDAVLRGPGNRTVGPISNTLQVVTVDRVKEWMISFGFNGLSVIPDGRARTVHATLPGRLQW